MCGKSRLDQKVCVNNACEHSSFYIFCHLLSNFAALISGVQIKILTLFAIQTNKLYEAKLWALCKSNSSRCRDPIESKKHFD